jgi:tetratricopeptide (TPR) repeat protein
MNGFNRINQSESHASGWSGTAIYLLGENASIYACAVVMKRARMISEGALGRLRQSALESWRRQDYEAYFKTMEQASRQDPANPEILLDMGAAYGMRYDYPSAERCFEKAFRVASNKDKALVMAGTQCRGFDRYEMARDYFERAIKEPKASPDTYVKLAEIYERFRLLEEAGSLVDKALTLDPACALATLVRARLDRLSGRTEEAERRLRPLLAKSDRSTWSTRIRGWYELGATLDAQGRYDEAMAALLEAKSMILPNAGGYISAQTLVQTNLKRIPEKLNREMVDRWKAQAVDLQPTHRVALLCGHPRSGTTLLEQVLDSHPDFVSAEETTIFLRECYWALMRRLPVEAKMLEVLESASSQVLRQVRQNYMDSMTKFLPQPPGGRILIDKNPSLTALVLGFTRVFPEAKLLVALRDPRDVCLSCFMQPLPLGQGSSSFLSLEGTIKEYASVMGLWKAAAPCLEGSFLEIRYEDLVENLEKVSRQTLEFLGVPWNEQVLRFHQHAKQKLVRSPTYAAVTKPISKGAVGRWKNYQKYLEPWLETLAPFVKAFGYD